MIRGALVVAVVLAVAQSAGTQSASAQSTGAQSMGAQSASAQVEVSLPDGGSFRAGQFMPVSIRVPSATMSCTILADGALPTTVKMNGRSQATVPLLVISPDLKQLHVLAGAASAAVTPTLPPFVLAPSPAGDRVVGPKSAMAGEDAYAPTFAWRPGMDAAARRRIVEIGILVAIGALACSLLRAWRAAAAMCAASVAAVAAIAMWHRHASDLVVAGGSIIVESATGSSVQTDRWRYFTTRARREVTCSVPIARGGFPVFVDASQARAIAANLVCDAASGEVRLECRLVRGRKVAVVERTTTSKSGTRPDPVARDSPMLDLARRVYVSRDASIEGTARPTDDDVWNAVIVRRR